MTTITVTPDLVERLGNLNQQIEFRDSDGQLVGAYYPVRLNRQYVNPVDGSHFTEDEVRQMAEVPIEQLSGRPLEEILKDLESRQ